MDHIVVVIDVELIDYFGEHIGTQRGSDDASEVDAAESTTESTTTSSAAAAGGSTSEVLAISGTSKVVDNRFFNHDFFAAVTSVIDLLGDDWIRFWTSHANVQCGAAILREAKETSCTDPAVEDDAVESLASVASKLIAAKAFRTYGNEVVNTRFDGHAERSVLTDVEFLNRFIVLDQVGFCADI